MNVKPYDVVVIQATYQQPKDRLLHIILAFLNQAEPTWRVIVEALRSPVVNLLRQWKQLISLNLPQHRALLVTSLLLLRKLVIYFLIESDEIDLGTCKIGKTFVISLRNIVVSPVTVRMQNDFQKQFNVIKKLTVQCMSKLKMKDVVNVLASIVAVGGNKLFSEGTINNF